MQIYEKPTRKLMHDMVEMMSLKQGDVFTRSQVMHWFQANYPLINDNTIRAHLRRMSTNVSSRVNHNPKPEDDLFFQVDSERFRLFNKDMDPLPIYERDDSRQEVDDSDEMDVTLQSRQEFAYEKDLQRFLVKNLSLIEPGLTLYEEDGIRGIEFDVGGRFVDILAVDKNQHLVVIELKVSKGYDRVVGQLLRYVGWVRKNMASDSQKVRGLIIARTISEDLKIACADIQDVQLFEYALSISVTERKCDI